MVNEWSRDDLPTPQDVDGWSRRATDVLYPERLLDAVVECLNEHHPKPKLTVTANVTETDGALRSELMGMLGERDRLKSLLEDALAQRDAAAGAEAHWAEQVEKYRDHLREVRRARDEAVEASALFRADANKWRQRAEKAERGAKTLGKVVDDQCRDVLKITEAYDLISGEDMDGDWGGVWDRLWEMKARTVAAEARTAPAVTRDEVDAVVIRWVENGGNIPALLDDMWALVSGDDPAVHVVRESDVTAVEVVQGGNWRAGTTGIPLKWTAQKVREMRDDYASEWVECEAIARAIEAVQAPDPVIVKARALYSLAYPGALVPKGDGAELTPFRRIAAHVLDREANDA